MKPPSTIQLAASLTPAVVLLVTLVAIIGALQTGCTSCRVNPANTAAPASSPTEAVAPRPTSSPRLVCPNLGSSPVQALAAGPGSHRVILKWRASAPANAKHDAAVGYCVYRSKEEHDPHPQLVNSIPFQGTSCADDWVENASKYHYTVRAISAKWVLSDPSNVAHAEIPAVALTNPTAPGASAPLCRQPAPVK